MSNFLGGRGRKTQKENPENQLRISSSVEGNAIPIVYGRVRVSPNCIWAGGFSHYWDQSNSSRSGKGGSGGGAGGKNSGGGNNGKWHYSAYIQWSLCEGPIANILAVLSGSNYYHWPVGWWASPTLSGLGAFYGDYTQLPWITPSVPIQLAYRGHAMILGYLDLGDTSSIPNISVEIESPIRYGIPALGPDAHPMDIEADFLTNPHYGVPSFPVSLLGDRTDARNYATSLGLVMSIALTSPTPASQFLSDLADAINCEYIWSAGKLNLVPNTDHEVSGNGATYTPPSVPIYDLTIDDFLPNQGRLGSGDSSDTVSVLIADQSKMLNRYRGEFLDRGKFYNTSVVDVVDEASIALYGMERRSDTIPLHMFSLALPAYQSLQLRMARDQIARTFQFTLGPKFILLDPMDVVTITHYQKGLYRQAVRIKEIQENADGSLTFTAVEYLGRVSSPLYGYEASAGAPLDRNVDPGAINPPLIFSPPYVLANALELWIAVSGINASIYGGCDVWFSNDDVTYTRIGSIEGASKMGVLTSTLATTTRAVTGPTVDTAHTLRVDLSQSAAALETTSHLDMLAAGTALYVDGEIVAYETATLTGPSAYDLTPLLRGAFDTPISAHAAGAQIVKLDDGVLRMPITNSQVGALVYFKFQPKNIWGGIRLTIDEIGAVPYQIPSAALSGTLAAPQNPHTVFEGGFTKIWWDEVEDFRPDIRYEIRQGSSFLSSIAVGNVAHPPFIAFGEGTYYITATVTPAIGIKVVSTPATITIAGNMLLENVLIQRDERAADWPGTRTDLSTAGPPGAYFLTLDVGATVGTYEVQRLAGVTPDLGYVGTAKINVNYSASGVNRGDDFLAVPDFLAIQDFLGAHASVAVKVYPMIAISDGSATAGTFGPWQKFVPGEYQGRSFSLALVVECDDPTVQGVIQSFSFTVSVKPRIDHYVGLSVPSGGLTITFQPDGAASPGAFNGGPNGSAVPLVNVSWPATAGDVLVLSGITASQATVQILNGGVGVARSGVTVLAEGY